MFLVMILNRDIKALPQISLQPGAAPGLVRHQLGGVFIKASKKVTFLFHREPPPDHCRAERVLEL